MQNENRSPIQLDIVSDVVCPWCIVGYQQLKKAMAMTDTKGVITWHPFELNPQMATGGENLREHAAAKYGTTPEGSATARANFTSMGAQLGFEFNYADDMRMYNTFQAHQLLHWAKTQGLQHELKLELFGAFFTQGLAIDDSHVLAAAARNVGLGAKEALAVLQDARFAKDVRAEQAIWTQRGVSGVPSMIFNKSLVLTGAQGVERYVSLLKELRNQQQINTHQHTLSGVVA